MSADCDGLCRPCTCPFPPTTPRQPLRAAQTRRWHREAQSELDDLAEFHDINPKAVKL
ncbi:hypothetical protein GCM10010218_19640 [Streptomyces mashuensis]|uniref:Uncharacterized protein n=1 Tax=Streptomyces mashuensis TaxID=33904 RepID=A0A919B1D3_9ACTN|nr:hypothetical protein [Streptomyces mashuensis]GHF38560.1 hypothetical protein GCM10010218_19640 [Streptomyces mashuensis]